MRIGRLEEEELKDAPLGNMILNRLCGTGGEAFEVEGQS